MDINNMTNTMMGVYVHNNESHTFNFITDLTAYKKLSFVDAVVGTLVDEERYNSIIRDLVFDFEIIKSFTDVDTSIIYTDLNENSQPLNPIDDIEQFLLETNIAEIVKANAFPTLFDELNKAVDDNIEYLTGIHPNPFNVALASFLSTLEKKIDEVDLNSMMEMAQKFAGMTGELTTEGIVNAYMNSDIHKQNLAEIEKAKVENQTAKKSKKTNKRVAKVELEETEKTENVD